MIFLRQSTAGQEVQIGKFVDDGDFKTAETALSIANTDVKLWKEGATSQASKNSGGATHIANGWYYVTLDATDTNTIGNLIVTVDVSGALSVMTRCVVLDEAVYDVLFGTTAPSTLTAAQVNTEADTALSDYGALKPTTAGRTLDVTATGAAGVDWGNVENAATTVALSGTTVSTSQAVASVSGAVGSVTARVTANTDQLAGQTVTAAAGVTFPSSVGTSTLTQAQVTGGAYALNSSSFAFDAALDFTTTQKASIGTAVAASAVASVTGNVGGNVVGSVASIATGGITSASFAANSITAAAIAADAIGASELAADAVAEIQSGLSTLTQVNVADAVWNAATASYGTTGSYGMLIETNIDAAVSTRSTYAGADTSGTTTLLGRLTGDRAGYLDNLSGGAVATAANLATVAGYLDTEIAAILEDTGTTLPAQIAALSFSTLDAAGVRTAVGLASANLDTQLAAKQATFTAATGVSFPSNFGSLGINASGHVSRVVLVDTTTTNTDMRGTDGAYTGTPPTANQIATAWGSRVIGNGRTADMYLQGLTNRVEFAADGLSWTLYAADDTTALATGAATRLGDSVGGLRSADPA